MCVCGSVLVGRPVLFVCASVRLAANLPVFVCARAPFLHVFISVAKWLLPSVSVPVSSSSSSVRVEPHSQLATQSVVTDNLEGAMQTAAKLHQIHQQVSLCSLVPIVVRRLREPLDYVHFAQNAHTYTLTLADKTHTSLSEWKPNTNQAPVIHFVAHLSLAEVVLK